MKRYYILKGDMTCATDCAGWYVVPTKAEPIGDNLFYRKIKWCGVYYLELYDMPSGTYILRARTQEDLECKITSERFKNQLEKARKSDFYKLMLTTFKKATREYEERVKGRKK